MRPPPSANPVPRISWRDLAPMRRSDTIAELLHPLPWLVCSLLLAQAGWWLAALPCSFMVFLTALRLNHEAIHGNLGLARRGDRAVLHALSAMMLGSNHAVAFNHMHHHATDMGPRIMRGIAAGCPSSACLLMDRVIRSTCIVLPGAKVMVGCAGKWLWMRR